MITFFTDIAPSHESKNTRSSIGVDDWSPDSRFKFSAPATLVSVVSDVVPESNISSISFKDSSSKETDDKSDTSRFHSKFGSFSAILFLYE